MFRDRPADRGGGAGRRLAGLGAGQRRGLPRRRDQRPAAWPDPRVRPGYLGARGARPLIIVEAMLAPSAGPDVLATSGAALGRRGPAGGQPSGGPGPRARAREDQFQQRDRRAIRPDRQRSAHLMVEEGLLLLSAVRTSRGLPHDPRPAHPHRDAAGAHGRAPAPGAGPGRRRRRHRDLTEPAPARERGGAWHDLRVDVPVLFDALDRALRLRLLEERGEGYAFRYPVVRAALYDCLPRHRQDELRAALAAPGGKSARSTDRLSGLLLPVRACSGCSVI